MLEFLHNNSLERTGELGQAPTATSNSSVIERRSDITLPGADRGCCGKARDDDDRGGWRGHPLNPLLFARLL